MEEKKFPQFSTLGGTWISPHIFNLVLNRPEKFNAMNPDFFQELLAGFKWLGEQPSLRVVLLTGSGKHFCAGLDLNETSLGLDPDKDGARNAVTIYNIIKDWQNAIDQLSQCRVPVICAVHGACIGGGIDLITAADVRMCTENAKLSIKEVDIGMCADVGTPQRIIHLTGNDSLVRELMFTGRYFSGVEAKNIGLVSKVCKDEKELREEAIKLAQSIAEKSPVAIWTIKQVLNHDRNKMIREGLDFIARMNMSMLNTGDIMEAVKANLTKSKGIFAKL